MLYLPADFLKPGMVLARGVPSSNPLLPLLVKGQQLTQDSIKTILHHGIKGLYIESELSEGIDCEEILDPEEKHVMLTDIKSEFTKLSRGSIRTTYRKMGKMAESIVLGVLDKDGVLCNVMDIRDYDNYTYAHSLYVSIISVVLGKSMGLNETQLNDVATAGLLHDIGKLDIPAHIINKPGPLEKEEFDIIKQHPMRAVDRLRSMHDCREAIIQGVASHHEFYNGDGYPRGLKGDDIPLYGRILAIADVYDALSAKRSYREPWTQGEILDYLTSRSGVQFDPALLGNFLAGISAYPAGSLVKLSDDSVGIVVHNHGGFALRPTVRLIHPASRTNEQIDLSQDYLNITVVDTLSRSDWDAICADKG